MFVWCPLIEVLQSVNSFNIPTAYEVGCFYNPNFAEEETEAEVGEVI